VIYLNLYPETAHGEAGSRWGDGDAVDNLSVASFAEATAAATGQTARNVRRSVARGEALGELADVCDGWHVPILFSTQRRVKKAPLFDLPAAPMSKHQRTMDNGPR
jgi:hypothetical protein